MIELRNIDPESQINQIEIKCVETETQICPICYNDCMNFKIFICNHHLCNDCFDAWFIDRKNTECCICRTCVVIHENEEIDSTIINNDQNDQYTLFLRIIKYCCFFLFCLSPSILIHEYFNRSFFLVFLILYIFVFNAFVCVIIVF